MKFHVCPDACPDVYTSVQMGKADKSCLADGEQHLEEEQLVLIKHKLVQENRLLIQESQL